MSDVDSEFGEASGDGGSGERKKGGEKQSKKGRNIEHREG